MLLKNFHAKGWVHGSIDKSAIEINPTTYAMRLARIRAKFEFQPFDAAEADDDELSQDGDTCVEEHEDYRLVPSFNPLEYAEHRDADIRAMFATLESVSEEIFRAQPTWVRLLMDMNHADTPPELDAVIRFLRRVSLEDAHEESSEDAAPFEATPSVRVWRSTFSRGALNAKKTILSGEPGKATIGISDITSLGLDGTFSDNSVRVFCTPPEEPLAPDAKPPPCIVSFGFMDASVVSQDQPAPFADGTFAIQWHSSGAVHHGYNSAPLLPATFVAVPFSDGDVITVRDSKSTPGVVRFLVNNVQYGEAKIGKWISKPIPLRLFATVIGAGWHVELVPPHVRETLSLARQPRRIGEFGIINSPLANPYLHAGIPCGEPIALSDRDVWVREFRVACVPKDQVLMRIRSERQRPHTGHTGTHTKALFSSPKRKNQTGRTSSASGSRRLELTFVDVTVNLRINVSTHAGLGYNDTGIKTVKYSPLRGSLPPGFSAVKPNMRIALRVAERELTVFLNGEPVRYTDDAELNIPRATNRTLLLNEKTLLRFMCPPHFMRAHVPVVQFDPYLRRGDAALDPTRLALTTTGPAIAFVDAPMKVVEGGIVPYSGISSTFRIRGIGTGRLAVFVVPEKRVPQTLGATLTRAAGVSEYLFPHTHHAVLSDMTLSSLTEAAPDTRFKRLTFKNPKVLGVGSYVTIFMNFAKHRVTVGVDGSELHARSARSAKASLELDSKLSYRIGVAAEDAGWSLCLAATPGGAWSAGLCDLLE